MGQKGERHVATKLKASYKADKIKWSEKGAKGSDFSLIFPDGALEVYEVKTDFRAEQTGNLFFEYKCNGRTSGLTATQADKWAVLLPHLQVILVFSPKRMFNYLQSSPRARKIVGGDRMAAEGYVVPISAVMEKQGVEVIKTKTNLKSARL